ncbi:MAG: amidohydrolase family protein [Firmicutes bacterium]|nr:amidohydrolase family protein [Bacillota bacterium]
MALVTSLAVNLLDPAQDRQGEPVQLVWDDQGVIRQIIPLPEDQARELPWAVPAGVDAHTHIVSEGVHLARALAGSDAVPALARLAPLYHQVGFVTAIDAAVLPEDAPRVHRWVRQLTGLDVGFLVLAAHHPAVLREIRARSQTGLKHVLQDLVGEAHAIGVKVVNPSGAGRAPLTSLEAPGPYGFSPGEHLRRLAEAVAELSWPHPLHIHGLDLGVPGNVKTTLEMLQILEGLPVHLAHLQFHCYGQAEGGGLASGAAAVADWINGHPEVSCDVGQIAFGDTVTLSNDLALQARLKSRHGNRWAVVEGEDGGLAAVPYRYDPKQATNAIQWAVGLELALLIDNPWQVFCSTDHPNGGGFWQYPLIERWLMDRGARDAIYRQFPKEVRRQLVLGTIAREYSDQEMAVFTSAGPARRLGLQQKGQLGLGAHADLALYARTGSRLDWGRPTAVVRRGRWVWDGRETADGQRCPASLWRLAPSARVEEDADDV